jgi:serine protease inhibitor
MPDIRVTWLLGLTLAAGAPGFSAPTAAFPQADLEATVKGNNAFALDLYAQLRSREGNLFLSPYSISTALAMTYAGAQGQTAEQMARTLHFPADQPVHAAFAALNRDITAGGRNRDYQLYIANALWGQKGYQFLPSFVHLIQTQYGAETKQLDFQHATEEARRTINTWVEKQTKDKIKDLLAPGVLSSATRLVLTNAIYFKGTWASPFKKPNTRTEDFHVTAEQKVPVSMMHQTASFNYLEEKEFQALELPYAGTRLAMVMLLPRKVDGLAEFERRLTPDKLAAWLSKMDRVELQVALPKYQLTTEFQLSDALSSMGMSLAFRPGEADFSGMDGKRDLFLSAVVHQAFVDVNEEGTEAAAATGAVMTLAAARPQHLIFRADHPFLFLIRDRHSGSILFLGRLSQPR